MELNLAGLAWIHSMEGNHLCLTPLIRVFAGPKLTPRADPILTLYLS
jgi:hypothetical protein